MNLGIVTAFNSAKNLGQVTGADGRIYNLRYIDGCNMGIGSDVTVPQLTMRHLQPPGYQLKLPRVGDPVVFVAARAVADNQITTWGYARHFIELAERTYGTDFAV